MRTADPSDAPRLRAALAASAAPRAARGLRCAILECFLKVLAVHGTDYPRNTKIIVANENTSNIPIAIIFGIVGSRTTHADTRTTAKSKSDC